MTILDPETAEEEFVPDASDAEIVSEFERESQQLAVFESEEERAEKYVEMVLGVLDYEDEYDYPDEE